jgi:hypothetical protein
MRENRHVSRRTSEFATFRTAALVILALVQAIRLLLGCWLTQIPLPSGMPSRIASGYFLDYSSPQLR